MKKTNLQNVISAFIVGFVLAASSLTVAQSQALNGQIEGSVLDQNGSAVPNAIIKVTNAETGTVRTDSTDESGIYRFPLLPLGTYRITVEAANFKKIVRDGITLATGQTVTLDLNMEAGEINDVVTISGDSSIADAGKTDLGRVMDTQEVQNLPQIARNPYNFAFLQANVTGRPARGFPFTTINANGYLRRANFLLDGNTNTQGDRGTLRFVLLSETYVSEVQLITNGFAAEFGNTPGLIMNVVTPSGTNELHGSLSYLFRRPSFYSRPFFFSAAEFADNSANNFSANVGAPIIKDRWHFYAGYEWQYRNDAASAQRLLTIKPADRDQLIAAGLPASIFPAAIPSVEKGSFYIFRTDLQLNNNNRLTARYNRADLSSVNLIQGMLNTTERGISAPHHDYAIAAQLVSYVPSLVNEFRFQRSQRVGTGGAGQRNEFSGTGPSIMIRDVANFGSPEGADTISPPRRITQFQDNLTQTMGTHIFKFGGGFNFYDHSERAAVFSRYIFPSIASYIDARNGTTRNGYSSYNETFGDPSINYKATFWNFFVQDDWKITPRLKATFGLRYDLYQVPDADPAAPFPASQKFNVDKNNIAPRFGLVYAMRQGKRPTVLRAGAGIYYDLPLLAMYQRALINNGNPRFFTFTITPSPATSGIAPLFPNTLGSLPPGATLPRRSIDAISPDFVSMYALHSNVQVEQAITEDFSVAAGFIHSGGRHLPIYRNINCLPVGGMLSDGRPIFGTISGTTVTACTRRIFPQFQNIQMVESGGVSRYDALTLQLTQRFSRGLQFSANYTLSKSTDDSPEQNMTTGSIQGLVSSDPTYRGRDRGNSFADQRHTFVMSMVARPRFSLGNRLLDYLFDHNQFGIIAIANSGETFNIISGTDLNRDGFFSSDRPVGITRNSGKTPPQYNVDLRYSRFFNFTQRYRIEVLGEFQNLFNINSIVQFNAVTVPTNPITGELIGQLPDFEARNQSTSQESRQFQLGLKFHF